MVNTLLPIHDPVRLGAEFLEAFRRPAREHALGRSILYVGGQSERGNVEPISRERIAVKVRISEAIAEGRQQGGAERVIQFAHHRLCARGVRAARPVGRVVVTEQVRIGSVTAHLTVAATHPRPFAEVVIALDIDLMVGTGVDPVVEPIRSIGEVSPLLIRQRQVTERLEGDRVHHAERNFVAGEWSALDGARRVDDRVERIIDRHQLTGGIERLREVTCALQCGRNRNRRTGRALLLRVFVTAEEECLVFNDWPAQHAAVLIAAERWKWSPSPVGEPVVRVQSGIAEKVVTGAVEVVPARAGHHVHHSAACLTVLRRKEVRLHLELLHHIHGR